MDFYHKLSEAAGADHILKDEPMSAHTTFRIGGPADYLLCLKMRRLLEEGLHFAERKVWIILLQVMAVISLLETAVTAVLFFIFVIQWMMLPMRKKGQNCWWKQVPV